MVITEIEGIVVKQIDYRDNDAIITILSSEEGLISLYARGIKKPTSKNAYACSVLTLGTFQYQANENGLSLLRSAQTKKNYIADFTDFNKIMVASIMVELVTQVADDRFISQENLYNQLLEYLDYLSKEPYYYLTLNLFLSFLIKKLGIEVIVDECVSCGSKHIHGISTEKGGFICKDCFDSSSRRYEVTFLKQFRLVNKAELMNYHALVSEAPYSKEMVMIFQELMVQYGGISAKAFICLKELPEYE